MPDGFIDCKDISLLHVLLFLCRARQPLEVAWWLQCLQGYLTPSWTALLCWGRSPFVVAWWLHCLQRCLTPSCIIFLCLTKIFLCDTWWPHILQLYFSLLIFHDSDTGNINQLICLSYECWSRTDQIIMYLEIIHYGLHLGTFLFLWCQRGTVHSLPFWPCKHLTYFQGISHSLKTFHRFTLKNPSRKKKNLLLGQHFFVPNIGVMSLKRSTRAYD